jgi:hypothetical protein
MKKMEVSNELWEQLLGFRPHSELKTMIMNEIANENLTLVQACARHAFPGPLIIMEPGQDSFEYQGRTYTPQLWEEKHPSRTLVIIH